MESRGDLGQDVTVRAKVSVRTTEGGTVRVRDRASGGDEHELTWRDYKKLPPKEKRVGLSEKAIAAHKARHASVTHPWRGNDYLKAKAAFDQRRASPIPTEVP